MPRIRTITAAATVAAAFLIAPAWAAASTVTDDSIADFAAGTGAGTWAVAPGVVQLEPSGPAANFADGAPQPSDWTPAPWSSGGAATFTDGVASIDGARLTTSDPPSLTAPQTLVFRATFAAVANQHVGFGDTFAAAPWAMFSTGSGTAALPVGLYARSTTGSPTNTPIAGVDPLVPHVYRIEWGAANVTFYVDDVLKATLGSPTSAMRPVISDLAPDGTPVKVDWIGAGSLPASGTFESRVQDAGSAGAAWGTLTGTGTGVTFATRTGNTPTPDGTWSAYEPVGTGGQIASPPGRYLQYQATLSGASATLDKVEITNEADNTAPTTSIDGVAVNGTSASATFSSPDRDVARFECSLDGGAFATCASPDTLTGLAAGGHSIAVRAVDTAGNTGDASSQAFTIAEPPGTGGQGGSGGSGGGTPAADTVAPAIKVPTRAVRVSRQGTFAMTFRCPRTEHSCKLDVQIERSGLVIALKNATIAGGKARALTFRVSKATRRQLTRAGKLKVKATVVATDAAGNRARRTGRFELLAPRS